MSQDNEYWNHTVTASQPGQQGAAQPQGQPDAASQSEVRSWHEMQQGAVRQQTVPQQVAPQSAQAPFGQPAQAGYAQASQSAYPGHTQTHPQQSRGRGWIVAIVAIVCLFLLVAFGVKSCNDSMNSIAALGNTGTSSLSGLTQDAVAVMELGSTIQYDGTACSPEGFKKLLDQAKDDGHVKAVVIRVNSGGGAATAGEEMAEYLRQFEKPVVVSSASINASAAYEISAQADYIYVAKSTEIGAIGTVMEVTDLSGLFEKLGVSMETIKSADSKDSSYGYRPLTEEERTYYQNMVNQMNDMFIENVAQGRKMDVKDVRKLATGLVFTGVDAVDNGLADAIGTREDAIKKAAELAGITDYTTTDLYLSNYDLSNLAYLFGEDHSQGQELLKLKELLDAAEADGMK